jgi:hypothetical protein
MRKNLRNDDHEKGFYAGCNMQLENDMRLLRGREDDSFAFLAELTL